MDKYGVQEEDLKKKTASTEKRCPDCGSVLTQIENTNVPHCPKCGTKPFEKKPR